MDQAIPVLRVSDAPSAAAWYGRLGYEKEWEHRFGPTFPAFLSITRHGVARLFLSEHHGDAPAGTLVYLQVADVDAVAAEFGVEVLVKPWAREVHLTDPDGNRVRIGAPIP